MSNCPGWPRRKAGASPYRRRAPCTVTSPFEGNTVPLNTMKDLLVDQITELYAAEVHRLRVLPELERSAHSPALVDVLRRHGGQTRLNAARLEEILHHLAINPHRHDSHGM